MLRMMPHPAGTAHLAFGALARVHSLPRDERNAVAFVRSMALSAQRFSRLLALACCAGVVLAPTFAGVAVAQDREPPAEAMTYFEQAREAYRQGRYPDAATDLERALVLDPNAPALLFNLGRVYELMGRYDEAIDIYTRLQAITPVTEQAERGRTEQILERLRGAREHAAPPPSVETVGSIEQGPTFVRERGVADVPCWATLGAGGAITIAAAILGGLALSSHADLASRVISVDYPYTQYDQDLNAARVLGGVADVMGGLGGATIIGALLLFGLRERVYEMWPEGEHAATTPTLEWALSPGGLALRGTF